MSIQRRIQVFLIITFLLLFSLILVSYIFHLQRQSASIRNGIIEKKNISNATFSVLSSNINGILEDYTFWDDMVYNILQPNEKWFIDNIDQLPTSAKINYAWLYNINKDLLHYTTDGTSRYISSPLPTDQFDKIIDIKKNGKKRFCHFYLKDSSNIVEIFGATVHKTNDFSRIEKANGYFFIGKVWNKDIFDKLSHIIDCKIEEIKDTSLVDTKNKLIFFKTLYNYNNEPSVELKLTASIDFINNEKKYSNYNLVIYGIIITLVFAMYLIFVSLYIARPLRQISNSLTSEDSSFISKLSSKNDEFGEIASLILRFFVQKEKLVEEINQRKTIQDQLNSSNIELAQRNQEIHEKNMELVSAKEKAEESDRLKSAFLANMSHEIRTPMNAILGFSELIANPDLSPEKKDNYINIIQNNGNQLMYIINDLIDISKIEANVLKVEFVQVNINRLLSEIYTVFNDKISKTTKLSFTKSLSDKEITLFTDPARLHQILSNLIGNAIKFTHQGHIKFGYTVKNADVEFFVEDSGIGISKEDQQMIFERFGQVEHGITRKYGGTGLGLSITKELISLLGGTLWLHSEIDKGTTFYFTIPYKPLDNEGILPNADLETPDLITHKNKIVLVAEDEDINFYLLKEQLADLDIVLIHARDGKEAVEIALQNYEIDLVLMDAKMPFLNGYQATIEIKKQRGTLPIIMQTAFAQSSYKELALQAGCDDYLAKPFTREQIIDLLNKYIKD